VEVPGLILLVGLRRRILQQLQFRILLDPLMYLPQLQKMAYLLI
jgi:hypothetical protein